MKNVTGLLLFLLVLAFVSCDKEEKIVASTPPGVEFSSVDNPFQDDNIIHAAIGKRFTIYARFSDDIGLKDFNLYYPDWYLDNTIDLTHYYSDETLLSYDLSFNFDVPDDVDENEEFHLTLRVSNLGDLYTEQQVIVRLDGDYNAPVISEVLPINNSTVPSAGLRVQFRVQEDEELKYVVFSFPGAMVYDSITTFRGGKAYSYDEPYDHLQAGKYSFSIKAVDMFENTREKNVDFTISD
jgi:hypothetical protein